MTIPELNAYLSNWLRGTYPQMPNLALDVVTPDEMVSLIGSPAMAAQLSDLIYLSENAEFLGDPVMKKILEHEVTHDIFDKLRRETPRLTDFLIGTAPQETELAREYPYWYGFPASEDPGHYAKELWGWSKAGPTKTGEYQPYPLPISINDVWKALPLVESGFREPLEAGL